MTKTIAACTLLFVVLSCKNKDHKAIQESADHFINDYSREYTNLYTATSEAQWKANTEIKSGDSTNDVASQKAQEVMADFTGRKVIIDSTRYFLEHKK